MTKTVVWKKSARSNACAANSNASVGLPGNSIGCLVSPCDSQAAEKRSDCCVRVGMPVDGPPRCTFTITAGTSAKAANPLNSVISDTPGPEALVQAGAPSQPARITMPMEASSSSAWTMAYLALPVSLSWRSFLQCAWKASASEEEGVMGYQAHTVAPP